MKQETEQKGTMYMPTRDEFNKSIFDDGVNWQKKKDKAIIEELVNVLNWVRYTDIGFNHLGKGTQLSIDDILKKAQNHIKTN